MRIRRVLFSILVISLMSSVLFAGTATDKGKIMTDLDFNFWSGTSTYNDDINTETDESNLDLGFDVGYFVIDDLLLGVFTEFENEASETKTDLYKYDSTDNGTYFGIFARYFLMREKIVRPFAGIHAGMGSVKITSSVNDVDAEDMKFNVTMVTPNIGVSYFLNEHIGFHALASYTISSITDDDDHPDTNDMDHTHLGINIGTSISF